MRTCLKAKGKLKSDPSSAGSEQTSSAAADPPGRSDGTAKLEEVQIHTPRLRRRRATSQSGQLRGRSRQPGDHSDARGRSISSSNSDDDCFQSLSCDASPLQLRTASNSIPAGRPAAATTDGASTEPADGNFWSTDEFLARVYRYHRRGGFLTIALEDLCQLLQLALVLAAVAFALGCVHYRRVAMGVFMAVWERPLITRPDTCASKLFTSAIHPVLLAFLAVSAAMWTVLLCRTVLSLTQYWGTRRFYARRLGVASSAELANLTWAEVLERMLAALEQQETSEEAQRQGAGRRTAAPPVGRLTELDVCGRILRVENFTTALVSRDLLPLRARLPLLGQEVACLPAWLHSALHLALFHLQPWALFDRRGRLRPDCRRPECRDRLAAGLAQSFSLLGLLGLALLPLTLPCQALRLAFRFAVQVKRRPALLATRRWSAYGRARLRHFNELPHQLEVRLARGYEPAAAYVGCFSSQLTAVLASNGMFFSGAGLAALLALSALDPDLLPPSRQIVTGATVLGVVFTVCLALVPDENQVWCPEQLLKRTLGHIHYLPDDWQWHGREHKAATLDRFGLLFQLTAAHLVEELISPVLTPLLLLFALPSRSAQLVDFFRQYTVSTTGAGDVCAFSVLDVGTDGRPVDWSRPAGCDPEVPASESNAASAARQPFAASPDSKVELSLLQFHLAYPNWRPASRVSALYLDSVQRQLSAPKPSAVEDLLPSTVIQPSCIAQPTDGSLGNHQQHHVTSWQDATMSEAAIRAHERRNRQLLPQGSRLLHHVAKD